MKFNRVNLFEGFINEAKYTVRWSDGVQAGKELKSEKEAMQYAKGLIKALKKLQYVSVHKPGMSSTADKDDLLAWWGDGSYWDNKAKKDKTLYDMQIEESVVNEISTQAGLDDIVKGRTTSIEGIKMSKELAQGMMDWIKMSPYGKKYGKQILKGRIGSVIKPANAFNIERYLDGKTKKEWKEIYKSVKEAKESKKVNEDFVELMPNVSRALLSAAKEYGKWYKNTLRNAPDPKYKEELEDYLGGFSSVSEAVIAAKRELLDLFLQELNREDGDKATIHDFDFPYPSRRPKK